MTIAERIAVLLQRTADWLLHRALPQIEATPGWVTYPKPTDPVVPCDDPDPVDHEDRPDTERPEPMASEREARSLLRRRTSMGPTSARTVATIDRCAVTCKPETSCTCYECERLILAEARHAMEAEPR